MSSPAAKKSRFSPATVQLPSQPLPPSAALGSPPGTSTGISSNQNSGGNSSSSDQVQSAVMRYLQKRRYTPSMTEAFQRLQNTSAGVQSKAQFAMRELLRSEASSVASLALAAPPNVDPLLIEQQYARFKLWISESPDFYKPELAQLLYPIFTHLYLDLVLAGHKLIAQKFHKRHQNTFLGNPNFANFIRILNNILTPEDIQREETVTTFLSSKYSVTLSNRTFHYLMRYLQQQQSMGQPHVLLHVLHAKVDVRLQDALGAPSSKHEAVQRVLTDHPLPIKEELNNTSGGVLIKQEEEVSNGYITASSSSTSSKGADSMSKVLDVIKAVREGPTPAPSVTVYKVSNAYSSVICGSITEDSSLLITGCEDSSLIAWDLAPHPPNNDDKVDVVVDHDPSVIKLGCDPDTDATEKVQKKSILRGHSGPVYDLTYTDRGRYLMSVSEDTTMRLWDLNTGVNKAIYQGHSYPIWSVDTDRVGFSLVTGSMDRTAKLWHIEYTHPLRVYAGHEQDVDVVKFHPNCNYVATGGSDKTIRLWSHSDAKMVRVFNGHKGSISCLSFSPDGKYLASGGEDRRIKIWDLGSSLLFKELKGHNDSLQCLTWSKDSNLLASGGQDGLIRLWDINGHNNSSNTSDRTGTGNGPMDQKSDQSISLNSKCTNVISLSYSPHNTLLATGIAATTVAPSTSGSTNSSAIVTGAVPSTLSSTISSSAAALSGLQDH